MTAKIFSDQMVHGPGEYPGPSVCPQKATDQPLARRDTKTGPVMPGRPHLSASSTGIGIVLEVLVRVEAVTVTLIVRVIFPILLAPSLGEGNRLGGELRSVWSPLLCW